MNGAPPSTYRRIPMPEPWRCRWRMSGRKPSPCCSRIFRTSMGANLLTFLPEPLAADALYRFSKLDVVSPSVVKELRDMLDELAMQTGTGGRRVTNLGGAKQTADILNHFPAAMSDNVLGAIDREMPKRPKKSARTYSPSLTLKNFQTVPYRSFCARFRRTSCPRAAAGGRDTTGAFLPESPPGRSRC